MSTGHMLELPKAVFGIKIAQLVLAIIILGLAAFNVAIVAFNASGFTVFTCLFTILITVYYIVSTRNATHMFNWIAILILEIVAVVFWLCSWATQAALLAYLVAYTTAGYYYVWDFDGSSMTDRSSMSASSAYGPVLAAAIALSVIIFILYCVTLVFIALASHRHRTANRPMRYEDNGVREEQKMQNFNQPTSTY